MSLTAIIDAIDVNSAAAGIVVEGEADFGEAIFTEIGEKKAADGERTTGADRRPRVAVLNLRFEGTSEATRDALYNTVKAAVEGTNTADPIGTLTHNPGGWTANRYLDFYRGLSTIKTTETVAGHYNYIRRATVELVCKPFARATAIELPRNLVPDYSMQEDHNGDGVANSFSALDSGMTATKTIDGGQKLTISSSETSGDYSGVISSAFMTVTEALAYSERCEYKCGAASNARYDIYVNWYTSGDVYISSSYMLEDKTAAQADWIEAPNLNISAPATAAKAKVVMTISANATAAISGSLWVRDIMLIQAAAFETGDDGNTIVYGSEVSASPATIHLKNFPGDVDAEVFIQLIAGELSAATGTEDQLVIGAESNTSAHIISFSGDTDANALGGVCSQPETSAGEVIVGLPAGLKGRYLVACRLMVKTSGTPASNTFRLNVYPNAQGRGTPHSTDTISPCAALDKWQGAFFFGEIELPMGGRPEWDFASAEPQNSLGIECVNLASASWRRDYLVLIPMKQGHARIAGEILTDDAIKAAVLDTIGDPPGAYFEYEQDSTVVYTCTPVGGGGNKEWYWGSAADFAANIRSVYLPEASGYSTLTPSCGGCTLTSYDSASKVARFSTGANTTWNITITFPARDWWNYDNLPTVSNPTSAPDYDPIYIPAGDSVLVPLVAEYVNDANQDFKNVGAKVAMRIVPRYI